MIYFLSSSTSSSLSLLPPTIDCEVASKALRSQRGLLLNPIRHCLPTLANLLRAEYIIPDDVYEDVCNQAVSKSKRCGDLLECMEDRVESFPSDFIKIVHILESEPFLQHIAAELVHSYCECKTWPLAILL